MDAYSVAYDEGEAYDERRHMQALIAATGARHHLIVPKGEHLLEELVQVTIAQEEPSAGPGVYSQWQVMRLAGEDRAKVLLDGQGADELFGGYFAFYYPPRLRGLLGSGELLAAVALARAAVARGHSPLEVVARAAEPWIPRALFRRGRSLLGAGDWALALGPELRAGRAGAARARGALDPARFPSRPGLDPLTARQAADLVSLLLPSLLRYEDRNSMAFSIEARVPFLDYRVIELAFQLAPAQKLAGGETKGVLRRAMRGIVPDSILDRRDKRGFETPVMPWLLQRHFAWLEDLLLAGRAVERGLLDRAAVAAALARNAGGLRGPGHELWRMVSLELWLRAAFDPAGFATATGSAAHEADRG
jgi:asparagine synthase (glutamine-hydrolysing)